MFDWMSSPEGWIALVTLTVLEIVLGVDNIIFISILAGKLPQDQQNKARQLGLLLAMLMRIALLFSIAWVTRLTTPLFEVFGHGVSGRDLVLILGGLFLLGKSTHEIHENLEGEGEHGAAKAAASLGVGARADHAARHRLLARLGDHRDRDGGPPLRDGGGRRDGGRPS